MQRLTMLMLGLLAGMALILEVPFGRAHDADQLADSAPQKIRCSST